MRSSLILLLPLTLMAAGCGSTSHANLIPQPVVGMPAQFFGPSGAPEPAGPTCRNPLRAPDGVVTLTMVRSGREPDRPGIGWGDYAVSPVGSYGVRLDQLIRVECGSGVPAGVVPRT